MRYSNLLDYWLTDDGLLLLEAWARDGNTLQEIAKKIGVTLDCLNKWKKANPEIEEALKTGKEIIDYKVENALLKSALGFTTKEIKVTIGKKIFNGEVVELLKETTTKEIAPNVTACLAWLNNRKFDQWKRNRDRAIELDEEDNNISITIVRGPKGDGSSGSDNVNQEIKLEKVEEDENMSEKEKKKERAKRKRNSGKETVVDKKTVSKVVEDPDYWPDNWEEEAEG